ncbi:Cbp53E: Calbindin-32 [Crotalus adamanteus]|uniref:Cbp53E: Calbindin-32 n=1 Tax=Crotalus adamanteus TaxID=8729 RepID=A0AAW1B0Y3_CROAD
MANLEGEAAEWVTILHDEGIPELADPDAFLSGLTARFGDPAQSQWADSSCDPDSFEAKEATKKGEGEVMG